MHVWRVTTSAGRVLTVRAALEIDVRTQVRLNPGEMILTIVKV